MLAMAETPRKPLAKVEGPQSMEPHSIRFLDADWQALSEAARSRGLEPAVFVRMCALYGMQIICAPAIREASLGIPGLGAQMLAGSRRTRRF